ncbi:MAG TPA: thioesterase domain-containing protein [Bryobacteraceae bacterium]|nr:thioesterase domain-containing protein [Bryobacteraceae bacterium]
MHGVAGNAERFNNLIRHLGLDESIYVILEPKEILTRIEDTAARLIEEIRTVQPHGPYFLAGYSFGGLISFEMAQQLRREGEDVALVALIDCGQPLFRKDRMGVLLSPARFVLYLRRLKELLSDPGSRSTIYSRIRDEVWRLIFFKSPLGGAVRRMSRPDAEPAPPASGMRQAAKIESAMKYQPARFSGRISIFRAEERTVVDKFDRFLGWSGLANQIDVYDVPGDHVSMGDEPYVSVLGGKLRSAIETARQERA